MSRRPSYDSVIVDGFPVPRKTRYRFKGSVSEGLSTAALFPKNGPTSPNGISSALGSERVTFSPAKSRNSTRLAAIPGGRVRTSVTASDRAFGSRVTVRAW